RRSRAVGIEAGGDVSVGVVMRAYVDRNAGGHYPGTGESVDRTAMNRAASPEPLRDEREEARRPERYRGHQEVHVARAVVETGEPVAEVQRHQQGARGQQVAIAGIEPSGEEQRADERHQRRERGLERVALEPNEGDVDPLQPAGRGVNGSPWCSVKAEILRLPPERLVCEGPRRSGSAGVDPQQKGGGNHRPDGGRYRVAPAGSVAE